MLLVSLSLTYLYSTISHANGSIEHLCLKVFKNHYCGKLNIRVTPVPNRRVLSFETGNVNLMVRNSLNTIK